MPLSGFPLLFWLEPHMVRGTYTLYCPPFCRLERHPLGPVLSSQAACDREKPRDQLELSAAPAWPRLSSLCTSLWLRYDLCGEVFLYSHLCLSSPAPSHPQYLAFLLQEIPLTGCRLHRSLVLEWLGQASLYSVSSRVPGFTQHKRAPRNTVV